MREFYDEKLVETIFNQGRELTLRAAKSLIGKTIFVTSPEYRENRCTVREIEVKGFITEYDNAKNIQCDNYSSLQEYWEKSLPDRLISESKKKLFIDMGGEVSIGCWCILDDKSYGEPVFYGSDFDRICFYIIKDE